MAMAYAPRTPGSRSVGIAALRPVAPAPITRSGLTSGARRGSCFVRVLEKIFCAMDMAIAPPSELKKKHIASLEVTCQLVVTAQEIDVTYCQSACPPC